MLGAYLIGDVKLRVDANSIPFTCFTVGDTGIRGILMRIVFDCPFPETVTTGDVLRKISIADTGMILVWSWMEVSVIPVIRHIVNMRASAIKRITGIRLNDNGSRKARHVNSFWYYVECKYFLTSALEPGLKCTSYGCHLG